MKYTRLLANLPKPLRIAGTSSIVVCALSITCLSVLPSGPNTLVEAFGPWVFVAIGASSLALGLVLALDYRGSATAYANLGKAYRGESFWNPSFIRRFTRVFGTGLTLVGICFVVLPLLYLFFRR